MHYCNTTFHSVKPEQVEAVLTMFTQECFVGGHAAYPLDDGSYSIDAGENDLRALYEAENGVVKFICRYQRDRGFYDNKIQSFAAKHGITSTLAKEERSNLGRAL